MPSPQFLAVPVSADVEAICNELFAKYPSFHLFDGEPRLYPSSTDGIKDVCGNGRNVIVLSYRMCQLLPSLWIVIDSYMATKLCVVTPSTVSLPAPSTVITFTELSIFFICNNWPTPST